MRSLLAPPVAQRGLLPDQPGRPTPWIIAIMMFVTAIVAGAGIALTNAARLVEGAVESRYSVQIPDGAAILPKAVAAARASPEVVDVRPVPEAEVRQTLRAWLGPEAAEAGLPLPALVELDLRPGADAAALARRIESVAPGAQLLAYREQLSPLSSSLRALQWLALGLIVLMAAAMGASVVLATRGAFNMHRTTIEIMHGVGATDAQLVQLFGRRIASDALVGGVAGTLAACVVLLLVGSAPGEMMGALTGGKVLGVTDLMLLAFLPLFGALLALLVARTTVLKALRATL